MWLWVVGWDSMITCFLSSYFTKKRGETLFSQWFPIVGAVERRPKKHFCHGFNIKRPQKFMCSIAWSLAGALF